MTNRDAGGKWSVDPGWRSGRSPATPERLRTVKVPHIVPLCNTEPASVPTLSFFGRGRSGEIQRLQGFRGAGVVGRFVAVGAGAAAARRSEGGLAVRRRRVGRRG